MTALEPGDAWAFLDGAPPTCVPLLPGFAGTPWPDRAGYARAAAEWVWLALGSSRPGLRPGEREEGTRRLAAFVLDAYDTVYGSAHQVYLSVPALDTPPLPVFLNIWKASGNAEQALRSLSGADAPGAVRPPVIEEFTTGHLGRGLRVLRVGSSGGDAADGAELTGSVGYAFRSQRYHSDIEMHSVCPDAGLLYASVPALDELARCIVPVAGGGGGRA